MFFCAYAGPAGGAQNQAKYPAALAAKQGHIAGQAYDHNNLLSLANLKFKWNQVKLELTSKELLVYQQENTGTVIWHYHSEVTRWPSLEVALTTLAMHVTMTSDV